MTVRKNTHGGKRKDAGRPRTGRAPRDLIACSPEAKLRLVRWAIDHEVTLHGAADIAIQVLTQEAEP